MHRVFCVNRHKLTMSSLTVNQFSASYRNMMDFGFLVLAQLWFIKHKRHCLFITITFYYYVHHIFMLLITEGKPVGCSTISHHDILGYFYAFYLTDESARQEMGNDMQQKKNQIAQTVICILTSQHLSKWVTPFPPDFRIFPFIKQMVPHSSPKSTG